MSPSVLGWAPALQARAGGSLPVLVSPLAEGSPAGHLGGPPPLPCCAPWSRAAGWSFPLSLPPPLRTFALGPHDCSGGELSSVASSSVSVSARALCGVSSSSSFHCASPLSGAGRTLTGPLTEAAAAAPMGCAFRFLAPPALISVSSSSFASSILIAPLGAVPYSPSVGCSLLDRAVGGFFSFPHCPRPSSPRRDRDAVGAPRDLTTSGTPPSLGVDSSHDDSTPPVCVWS